MKKKQILSYFLLLCMIVFLVYSFKASLIEKIDVHEHVKNLEQAERILKIMDIFQIKKMVLLATPSITFGEKTDKFEKYDENAEELFRIKEKYPDRFLIFVTVDQFDKDAVEKLENYSKRGASGLKLYNGVIDSLGPINSSKMYEIYEKCRELNLPVLIHVESLNEIQREEFEQVLDGFPDLKFNCAHFCGAESNLELLSNLLDSHANLMTDMSPWSRVGGFAVNDSKKFRDFFIKYQDRILFGTDIVLDERWKFDLVIKEWFRCDSALLEKQSFSCYKERSRVLEGMNLPREILEKIYLKNAEKFLHIAI